jgi:hypothetical protein
MPAAATTARTLRGVRLVYGAGLVLRPQWPLARLRSDDPTARAFVRLLGARYVAEALLVWRRPQLLRAVDVLHAASMLPFARLDPRRRRVYGASAVMALAFGLTPSRDDARSPAGG